nr:hydroxysteroid 11-beta-dehydrogenase 1-like protein isoform X3 [Saimiri boliviensis boliviensis]
MKEVTFALRLERSPRRTMKVLLLTGLGALFFAYYWDDNFDPASLQGARVLLTGANAGVGEELAYHYARLGSHLVLTAHTEAFLQKVVGNCRKLGAPKIFYIAADMASPEAPESVVQFALDKLGGLDYLVLNHIGGAPAGTRARSAQATRWLMQVNFLSYVQLTSRALPSLTDSEGSLVVVSSLLGACARPRLCGTGSGELDAGEPGGPEQVFRRRGCRSAAAVRVLRPRARVVLHPVLGGQVRAGRLLRLPAAGAGRAGRERGHHHVRPGPPRSRLRRRGSQMKKLRLREVTPALSQPWTPLHFLPAPLRPRFILCTHSFHLGGSPPDTCRLPQAGGSGTLHTCRDVCTVRVPGSRV